MKYLKSFNENNIEPTLREKLESIVDMYEYICADDDLRDSLNNFIGNCSTLFLNCIKITGKRKRPYEFNIDCLVSKLNPTYYRIKEKLEDVEKLYKLSLIPKFKHTKEEIETLLYPILSSELFGGKILSSYKITKNLNGWYKYATFVIKCELDEDILLFKKEHIIRNLDKIKREQLREMEVELESYANYILKEVKNILDPLKFKTVVSYDTYFKFNITLTEL